MSKDTRTNATPAGIADVAADVAVETMIRAVKGDAVSVTLEYPIKRGEQLIKEVTLRKPRSGELRGMKLFDLLQLDVNALHTVLPRISNPTLTANDVAGMDLADLMQLGTEVAGFFVTKTAAAAAGLTE